MAPFAKTEINKEKEVDLERSALLATKLEQVKENIQKKLMKALKDTDVIEWEPHDLEPAQVPVAHSFKLMDEIPIHWKVHRMPPNHNDIVRK